MPAALITVTGENLTGFSDQSFVNTFAFASNVPLTNTVTDDMLNAVIGFYITPPAGETRSVGSYIAGNIDRTAQATRLRVYDISDHLDGTPYGSPIDTGYFTMPAAGIATNLPTQVAACLTLRGYGAISEPVEGPGGIRPRQRVSGRLFLGPLVQDAVTGSSTTESRLASAFRTVCLKASEELQDSLVDTDYQWGVWSRTRQDVINVIRTEMDDSPDVIRSRKLRPITRDVRTFAPVPTLIQAA